MSPPSYKHVDLYDEHEPIRTEIELKFEHYLRKASYNYLINQLFCFKCRHFYLYESRQLPSQCAVCLYDYRIKKSEFQDYERGLIARPDFLLDFNVKKLKDLLTRDLHYKNYTNIKTYYDFYLKQVGIIRIDGAPHEFNRHTVWRDYHQYKDFRSSGIKVFIFKNEEVEQALEDRKLGAICFSLVEAMEDDYLYEEYEESKDFKEKTKRPLMPK